ncbi:hypothetical protein [Mannheimia indoligenes]|uniref:Restriction endonuclease n=1 Tax=Mannheimia indoligenes TaxID=3103145 RepID=A0ABU7ZFV2_9PAST
MKLYKTKPLTSNTPLFCPKEWMNNHNENGMLLRLIANMRLLGEFLRKTHPTFFSISDYKGVLATILIPSKELHQNLNKPGDIDMLIIPYTENNIVFSESLAVEAKVIRASYEQQGKSPKKFGFTQAQGLYDIGFPYVAICHFIVSDISPSHTWEKMLVGTVGNNDTLHSLRECFIDRLPLSLIERAQGRLLNNRKNPHIGVCSCYMNSNYHSNDELFMPEGSVCTKNVSNLEFVAYIEEYYRKNWRKFFNILKNKPQE